MIQLSNKHGKYLCPCCEYYTFEEPLGNHYDICPVCYWEDDGIQLDDPTYAGGANRVSLLEARDNFKKFGASEIELQRVVRAPSFDEFPD